MTNFYLFIIAIELAIIGVILMIREK